jgi:hypothetical protein
VREAGGCLGPEAGISCAVTRTSMERCHEGVSMMDVSEHVALGEIHGWLPSDSPNRRNQQVECHDHGRDSQRDHGPVRERGHDDRVRHTVLQALAPEQARERSRQRAVAGRNARSFGTSPITRMTLKADRALCPASQHWSFNAADRFDPLARACNGRCAPPSGVWALERSRRQRRRRLQNRLRPLQLTILGLEVSDPSRC